MRIYIHIYIYIDISFMSVGVFVGVGVGVTIYTFDDAAQECVFPRAPRGSLRHTAAGIPQGGGGVCGGGGEVAGWLWLG